MNVFERIRDYRKNVLHMNQTEFGQALGVSRSVIKNMELNALARPEQKDPLIKLICKEFNLNEKWLRTGEGDPYVLELEEDPFTNMLVDIDRKDPRLKQAIIKYQSLSTEDKELFWNFMDKFIKMPEE